MPRLCAIIAIVILIYLDFVVVHSYTFSSTSAVLRRTSVKVKIAQNQPSQYLVYTDNFAYDDDESVYYATCDTTFNPDFQSCNLSRVTPFDADGHVKLVSSCEDLRITVNSSLFPEFLRAKKYQRFVVSLRPLARGHVAFNTMNRQQLEHEDCWTIVNVNNCSVTNPGDSLAIRWGIKYHYFTNEPFVYRDSVEVLIKNDTVNSTAQPAFYRVRYGYDGQKLDMKPINLHKSASTYPVQSLSHEKGFYLIYTEDWRNIDVKPKLIVTYAEPGNNEDRIIAVDSSQPLEIDIVYASVAHELLSACWPLNVSKREWRCIQTNTHGVLLNVTVKMSFSKYDWVETLSLPEDGGMLVVESNQIDKVFHVRRLARDGRGADKWLEVHHGMEKRDCSMHYLAKVREDNRRDEICFSVACFRDARHGGWYTRYERVCLLRSVIMETLN